MWQSQLPVRLKADVLALQSSAERAGLALACSFSSSAEFEAAVIASKLRAGIYGPKRRRRYMICGGAMVCVMAIALYMI